MARFINYKDLNKRISIFGVTNSKNEYGQNIREEGELFSCWASIREQNLNELKNNIGTVLEDTVSIVIRYKQKQAILNEHKIKFGDHFYQIEKLNKDEVRKEFITILAKRVS